MKNQKEDCELAHGGVGGGWILGIESSWEGLMRCVLMQYLVTLGPRN